MSPKPVKLILHLALSPSATDMKPRQRRHATWNAWSYQTIKGGNGELSNNNEDPAIINKINAHLTRWHCCWLCRAHSSPCPTPGPSHWWEGRVQEGRVKYSSSVWKLGIDIKVDKHQPIPYDSASDGTQNYAGKLHLHFHSFRYCAIYRRSDKNANE